MDATKTLEKPAVAAGDPSERVRTARAELEQITGELQAARHKVRCASMAMKEAEAAEKWADAQRHRALLPELSEAVGAIEEKHKAALVALAEAEEAVKAIALKRYEAVARPLIAAAEKFLERLQQEQLFRKERGYELGGNFYLNCSISQYQSYGLEMWIKEARKRAAQLFGERE